MKGYSHTDSGGNLAIPVRIWGGMAFWEGFIDFSRTDSEGNLAIPVHMWSGLAFWEGLKDHPRTDSKEIWQFQCD